MILRTLIEACLFATWLGASVAGAPPSAPPPSPGPVAPPAAIPPATPVAAPAGSESGALRTLAVMPFEAALSSYVFGVAPSAPGDDCGTVTRSGGDVARRCTHELLESIVATRRLRVVDRETVDRVLQEQNFHRLHGVDPKELARLGRLLGADRIVVGRVELAGTSCRRVEVRASGYVTFEFGGGIETTYRVLDVATGEVEAIGRLTRTWDSKTSPELRAVLSSPDAAMGFFARAAAQAQTMAVLDAIDPVKVAALQDGVVILNQGRGRPMLAPGTTLRVMARTEPIRDPDTGAILSEEGAEVAVIQVVETQERISRARVLSGDASRIGVGAVCRMMTVPSAER